MQYQSESVANEYQYVVGRKYNVFIKRIGKFANLFHFYCTAYTIVPWWKFWSKNVVKYETSVYGVEVYDAVLHVSRNFAEKNSH
jgi:hypothetical protein